MERIERSPRGETRYDERGTEGSGITHETWKASEKFCKKCKRLAESHR